MKTKVLMGMFCFVYSFTWAQQIISTEYFFDSDPGVGMGTKVLVSNPQDSVDVSFNIPLNFTSNGFHKLALRTENVNGTWSLNEIRTFFVFNNQVAFLTGKVMSYEYFIDTDPGLGKGTKGAIADTADITFNIPLTGLAPGFHIAGIRLFDSNNLWSENETRIFYILPDVITISNLTVSDAEYFIDSDPGAGKGTKVSAFTPADSVVVNLSAPITGLSAGFHKFLFRTKNSIGTWGMQDSRIFYIDSGYQYKSEPIIEAEYYLDNDPGLGKATQITPLTPGDSIVDNFSVKPDTDWVIGNHKMVVRVKDSVGTWSLPESRTFTITDSIGKNSILTDETSLNNFVLYPNPVADILNIKFGANEVSPANIEIFDYTGRKVHESADNLVLGNNQIQINVSRLTAGVFILRIQTLNNSWSACFVKQ
jgi:hypothetical protein